MVPYRLAMRSVPLLAMILARVFALPDCGSEVVELPADGDRMVFAVVGDWGRVGAEDSLFNPHTVSLCEQTGMCCSDLQRADLPANFDYSDVLDGPQQRMTATLLNEVCGEAGCQFVLGMGDNFYPCGADSAQSGLNRFVSDFEDIYQGESVPYLQGLTWYHVFGNHDYGFNFSVNEQISYGTSNPTWVTPAPYYSRTFKAGDLTMKVQFLDETPFITKYTVPGSAYYTNFLAEKFNPEYLNSDAAAYEDPATGMCSTVPANASFLSSISESATGQIPWLKSCLSDNSSTWDVLVGHYALYGSDVNWAYNNSKSGYPGVCGAWGSLANLVEQYSVDAYFNGHDHTQTHSDPSHAGQLLGAEPSSEGYGNITYLVGPTAPTQFFTLGNGGSIQYGDGVTLGDPKSYNNFSSVIYNQNVQYSAAQLSADSATGNAAVGEGFAIVDLDSCIMRVQFYSIENYEPGSTTSVTPAHTAVINKCGATTTASA